ncbi:ACS4 protein [Pelomyxa schiedti]|nr:ACS4 protein [Pelomyxa schiedti]
MSTTNNENLVGALGGALTSFGDAPLFGSRSHSTGIYHWVSYRDVALAVRHLACGLRELLGECGVVGICGPNRPEWCLTDFACTFNDYTSVGFHPSWPQEEVEGVISESAVNCIIVDPSMVHIFLEASQKCPTLKFIVIMPHDNPLKCGDASRTAQVIEYMSLVDSVKHRSHTCTSNSGYGTPKFLSYVPRESPYTIIYSSGTSGIPKGLAISKQRWLEDSWKGGMSRLGPRKVGVSYSALAHGMDRNVVWQMTFAGGQIGFARSEYEDLLSDLQQIKPRIFTAMPHFWNRFYSDFLKAVEVSISNQMRASVGYMLQQLSPSEASNASLTGISKLVGDKFWGEILQTLCVAANASLTPFMASVRQTALSEHAKKLGGELSIVGTGGASISDQVLSFMRDCFGCTVINSYGTTEVPGISANGVICDGIDVKLLDVPDMGYHTTDKPHPRGEILVRSKHTPISYWGERSRVESERAFKAGWYHTNDIGMIDSQGLLHIIDRKGSLAEIYLNGRSVWMSASMLEEVYCSSPLVGNVLIYSDRSESGIIAAVVPNISDSALPTDVGPDSSLYYDILSSIRDVAASRGLSKAEIPIGIVICTKRWSIESGELSPTGKIRRSVLQKNLKPLFEAEYARISALKPVQVEDYIDYKFVCVCKQDAVQLNALYEPIVELAMQFRSQREERARSKAELEWSAKAEILKEKEASLIKTREAVSAVSSLFRTPGGELILNGEGGSNSLHQYVSEAFSAFVQMKQAMKEKYQNFTRVKETSDPVITSLMARLNSSIDALKQAAQKVGVSIPYQITAGGILLPPASLRDKGVLPEGPGFPNWQVWCCTCGDLIEWGAEGEGVERFHCLECQNINHCSACHTLLSELNHCGILARNRGWTWLTDELTQLDKHIVLHEMARENAHIVWLRDKVVPCGMPHSLASVVVNCGVQYADRLCLGMPRNRAERSCLFQVPGICLEGGIRERDGYKWITYSSAVSIAQHLARGLRCLVSRSSFVGICGPNCYEWILTDFACALAGLRPVGMHTTFEPDQMVVLATKADLSAVVCSRDLLDKMIFAAMGSSIRHIIVFPDLQGVVAPSTSSFSLHGFLDVMKMGTGSTASELESPDKQPEGGPSDIYTLLFTSGSTAGPKAVMVSCNTFWNDITCNPVFVEPLITPSYIALSHSSDRMKVWEFFCNGGRVGFSEYAHRNWEDHEQAKKDGQLETSTTSSHFVEGLFQEVSQLRPTAMACPPKIWNGLYYLYSTRLLAEASPAGEDTIRNTKKAISSLFGDRLHFVITGGAATSPEVMQWAKGLFGPEVSFHESYGATECGAITEDGKPMPGVTLKLVDLPHLGITTHDKPFPRGEVVVKCPAMSSGYYKDPVKTLECFKDGFYHTGDLGTIDDQGVLHLLERVAAVTTVGGGKLLFPSKLEALYEGRCSNVLEQIFLYSQPSLSLPVALVTVPPTFVSSGDVEKDTAAVLATIQQAAKDTGLQPHEVPHCVRIVHDRWDVHSKLLNGQLKKVRPQFLERYKSELASLVALVP